MMLMTFTCEDFAVPYFTEYFYKNTNKFPISIWRQGSDLIFMMNWYPEGGQDGQLNVRRPHPRVQEEPAQAHQLLRVRLRPL